jgi:uncharacterized protein (TIGR02996 family)
VGRPLPIALRGCLALVVYRGSRLVNPIWEGDAFMAEDADFIEAILAAPDDEDLRLIYADWLEERGDPRNPYLRAEVRQLRKRGDAGGSALWSLQAQVDPIWAAMVSRAPFGILVPGLTFSDTGPKIGPAQLKKIEKRWQERLLPDYAAFLLAYNGGRPSKPYLWSYADYEDGTEYFYDEVRFFSTADKHPNGRPYLMMNVVEAFDGHVAEDADEERLSRMLSIGTVNHDDGSEGMLGLVMDSQEKFARIVELVYWEHDGLSEDEDVHSTGTFVELLMNLCEGSEE